MKSLSHFAAVLLCIAACAVLLATAACAQGSTAVTLPVSIRTAGVEPEPGAAYCICLRAEENAPLPDGAQNNQYSMTVQGAGDYTFPPVEYTAPGMYRYHVSHDPGPDARCTYDATIYDVTVMISNRQDGTGLESAVAAHVGPNADKRDALLFTNIYAPRPTTAPTATPVPTAAPTPVNTKSPATPVIHPAPAPTPAKQTLIQTGQLKWPVPVLGTLAALFAAAGFAVLHRGRKDRDGE